MLEFQVLFRKFIDDARVLPFDEIFMNDIEKIFKDKYKKHLNNIYKNAPSYYSKITESNEIFEIYTLWFLCILIIDYSNEESLKNYRIKNDLMKWILPRRDPNIKFFIIGPLQNQVIRNDFITHYRNIMNAQNSISDITSYQQLSSLQTLNIALDEFKIDFKNNPNVYNKVPNQIKAFTININSKDIDFDIINDMTTMNCSNLDIGDVSDTNIKAKYNELILNDSLKVQNSKIPLKKFETLLNRYDRFKLTKFEIDNKAFDTKLDTFENCYIVFDGIYVNERTIYSDKSNESLKIIGNFSYDNERNIFYFIPTNDYITFRKGESIVRKFNIYAYFPNVGNINKIFELELTYENFKNIFINTNKKYDYNIINTKSITNIKNKLFNNNIFKLFKKNIRNNNIRNSNIRNISNNIIQFNYKLINYNEFTLNSNNYYATENDEYNIFIHNDYYYIATYSYFLYNYVPNAIIYYDKYCIEKNIDNTKEINIKKTDRITICLENYQTYQECIILCTFYSIICTSHISDMLEFINFSMYIAIDNISYNNLIYINEYKQLIYEDTIVNKLDIKINYNLLYINDVLINSNYNNSYKIHIEIIKKTDNEFIILENNELIVDIIINNIEPGTYKKNIIVIYKNDKYIINDENYIGNWYHKAINYDMNYIANSFKFLSKNIYSYDDIIPSIVHIDLSNIYSKCNDIKYKEIDMKVYENCSGLLIDDEYIECSKYLIQGSKLYILQSYDNKEQSQEIDVLEKEFTIFPELIYKHIDVKDLKIYGYYKQNEYGYYEYVGNEKTNVAGLLKIYEDENILVILGIMNDNYIILYKNIHKDIKLLPYLINDISSFFFYIIKITLKGFDILNINNLNNKKYYINNNNYIEYPMPIFSMNPNNLIKYFNKPIRHYLKFQLELDIIYNEFNTFEYNELMRNNYKVNYNNYPLIITDKNLITNKNYKLIINNEEEYEGFLLKNDLNNYTFCTNNEIELDKKSKIILKLNDNIYSCSFQLD